MTPSDPLLRVQSISVQYGAVAAVRDLSFSVEPGRLVALLGRNGAGKSSTLLAIAGGVKLRSGAITLDGRDIEGDTPEQIARAGVSLVPEGRRIFGSLSVDENLRLARAAGGRRADRAIERALDRFPVLRTLLSSGASRLSGGQQQMLAIARALVTTPKLLLLDEPSLGLAPSVADTVFDTIDELKRDGATIVLVEQNAKRALDVADYAYFLRSGSMVLEGVPDNLRQSTEAEVAYLGAIGSNVARL